MGLQHEIKVLRTGTQSLDLTYEGWTVSSQADIRQTMVARSRIGSNKQKSVGSNKLKTRKN